MNKKLAIKGHPTRGEEVIKLLEMMGGKNKYRYNGIEPCIGFIIDSDGSICRVMYDLCGEFIFFSLEKFLEKYPFKVGDKIPNVLFWGDSLTVKSMNWDENYKTIMYGFEESVFVARADELSDYDNYPNKSSKDTEEKDKAKAPDLKAEDFSNKRFGYKIPDGYEFDVVVDGKIILKPIKTEYPTTFEECLNMLYCKSVLRTIIGHKAELLLNLEKLLICRDAYWKIAGEELELGKPWKPKFGKYIHYNINFYLYKDNFVLHKGEYHSPDNRILVFPTEEMRDAFYENFKDLIESCKELL